MEDNSGSSPASSRGRTSLCGLSGGRKSTHKESQSPSRKDSLNASRKSTHNQPKKDSSHSGLESSPNFSEESSFSASPATESQDASAKKLTWKQRWRTYWQSRRSNSTRSFFNFRKQRAYSPADRSMVRSEQGASEDAILMLETSSLEGKTFDSKLGHRGTVLEIKPNTVSERRAAFENLTGEEPVRSIPKQQSGKAGKKAFAEISTLEDSKLSSEEGPSCSYQNVQSEQLPSSSPQLKPADEMGKKTEKKKQSKRSLFQFFKSKRSKQENSYDVNEKSKSKDKKKTKIEEKKNNNEDESCEASGGSSTVATGSSHINKSQSELKTKTPQKDAKQGKTGKHSLLQEQNKSRDSMMKAIRKGVENLTVPEQSKPATVKGLPAIDELTTSAESNSHSERRDVKVPDDDDEVFFSTPKSNANQLSKTSATIEDLDLERAPILPSTKKAMPQKNQRTSGNPVKNLAKRSDLVTSYEEKPATNRSSGFTKEALRGLASTEDFSRVALKKVDSSPAGRNQPFKEKMLLLIKGRKNCHARLVEPCVKSVNTGDCYVLVTPNSVHVWIGQFCNVLEKSKATDVAKQIVVKRDLGCKVSSDPIVIGEETKYNSRLATDFWTIIGEKKVPKVQEKGPQDEDDRYEKSVCETNIVYKVNGRQLMPLEEHCGKMLSYDMLNTNASAVLVFDFGGEMYVWMGKQSPIVERQYGMLLAEELWKQGYDYTSFPMNPLSLLHDKKSGGLPLKDRVRPAWAFLGKVLQSTETILFKEKFFDWPDSSRIIQCRPSLAQSESKDDWLVELKACDVDEMIKSKREPMSFLWDGIRISRCLTWVDEAYGLKKEYEIETEGIDVWHVAEFACNEVDEAYHGNFFDGDTYVVRWRYQVNIKGVGTGKGGRTRCAYFFWQGESSSVTEKGACALMTVELDKEKGPQIRVVQNKEPPCFLALFKGRLIVHSGKKDLMSPSSCNSTHLYVVRNELPDEAYLLEIPVQVDNLRSRSSFLLLNAESSQLTIWHGCRSPEHTKQRAKELMNTLLKWSDRKMSEIEVKEGSESAAFWKTIGSSDRSQYDSLLKSSVSLNCYLHRAFQLSGVTLTFKATEVLNPSLNENTCCPFPVFQSDLYRSSQPALFLIDAGDVVYLWQGYWPLESNSTENLRTGSAGSRFTAERRCAMETVLAYCKAVNPTKPPPAYIVFAGVEPVSFTNLFPSWCMDETARTSSLKDGKEMGQRGDVSEALANMRRTHFTLAELQNPSLPDGVDPLKLESYLTDEEFKKVFDCDKDAFYLLPPWKQTETKKNLGLF